MATTVTSTRSATKRDANVGGGPGPPGPNGKGPHGNGWRGGKDDEPRRSSTATYSITTWVVLAAIIMTFATLSVSYVFLSGGEQWRPIEFPRMFFLSTLIMIASSVTLEVARRCLKAGNESGYMRWLALTLLLGLAFLGTQLLAWGELRAQGVYLASNPHSSFFYLFTGVHGVHLLGGVGALLFLVFRMRNNPEFNSPHSEASTSVVSRYWHAMDGVWVWLFLLLLVWR